MLKNVLNTDQEPDAAEGNTPMELPSMNDLWDDLKALSHVLEAFGTLLRTSSLFSFADEDEGCLRWGFSQIIDLYLEKQERITSEYADKYNKSNYILLTHAEKGLKNCKDGMFNTVDATVNFLKKDIKDLDVIIAHSVEFSERAQKAKKMIMDFIRQLKKKDEK